MVPIRHLELVAAESSAVSYMIDPVFIAELVDQLLGLSKGGRITQRL
jgi:hypothetical protein